MLTRSQVVEKLGLLYRNVRGIHKCVDLICPKAGDWKVRRLCFKDRPEEEFILRHRNILDIVKSLWGDHSLAQHLVYRPKSIFKDAKKTERTYSEMWSGKWWQYTQVCQLSYLTIDSKYEWYVVGQASKGCNCSPSDNCNQQDPAHSILRQ